jgi:hypothetical protein
MAKCRLLFLVRILVFSPGSEAAVASYSTYNNSNCLKALIEAAPPIKP